jgi:formate/nitrite transporter FocA (FNT family)
MRNYSDAVAAIFIAISIAAAATVAAVVSGAPAAAAVIAGGAFSSLGAFLVAMLPAKRKSANDS